MRLSHSLALILALGIGPLLGCPPKEAKPTTTQLPSAENGYGNAKDNFAHGVQILKTPDKNGVIDYAGALQWFDFATKADPSYAKAYYNAGWTAAQMGNMAVAAEDYRQAMDKDPANLDAMFNLGTALNALGKGDEAVALYQGYVDAHPEDMSVRNNLIEALSSAGRYDDAIEQTRELLRRDAKNVDAYRNLSSIYFAKGDNGMSQLCAEKAKTLAEGDPGIYNNMGVTYLVMNNEPKAIEQFKTAIKLAPQGLEPNMNLGYVALDSGDYKLAKDSFSAALKKDPGNVDAMLGMAVALRGVKDYDGAAKLYDQVIAADPSNKLAYFNAATLHERYTKDFKRAGKYLDAWIDLNQGKISPDDEVYQRKDRINKSQAEEDERKRIEEQKKKDAEERKVRQREKFEELKVAMKKLDADMTTYATCPAMVDAGAIDQGSMVLEQGKAVIDSEDIDMAGDLMSFVEELRPQLDAIIPSCGTAAPAPAPAPEGTPTPAAPAPADGTAAPAPADPATPAPAPAAGGQ